MGFAAVARVTADRWIACEVLDQVNFGLAAGGELPIKTTLCDEVRGARTEIVIDDVASDRVYANHHTPRIYGLQSYIAVPITLADGSFFGTLCAIDAKPAKLQHGPALAMFRLFAQLIARSIDDQSLFTESSARLAESLERAELREQFIAVLGHDLRNPLAALRAGMNMLGREPQTEKARGVLAAMQQSITRMSALVTNTLDFAHGRLGGGIQIDRQETRVLAATLDQIVAEMTATYPNRQIEVRCNIDSAVSADLQRVGQLVSNLLGNAYFHGSERDPIRVNATIEGGYFELSVANGGDPIPPEVQRKLFQPFYRGRGSKKDDGLGLGLYIASQIAQAHGGRLDVSSDEKATKFTFRMPTTVSAALSASRRAS